MTDGPKKTRRFVLSGEELRVLIHACGCATFSPEMPKDELKMLYEVGQKLVEFEQEG